MKNIKVLSKYLILSVAILGLFLLVPPAWAVSKLDLMVQSITVSPTSPIKNASTTITVVGLNNSTSTATSSLGFLNYSYNFENFSTGSVTVPTVSSTTPVGPNGTFTYVFNGMFTATGTKNLSFTLDNSNQLDEANEANNTATSTVVVQDSPKLDLQAKSIMVSPSTPILNTTSTITVWAKNNSLLTATDTTGILNYTYSFPNFSLISVTNPSVSTTTPLDPNESFSYVFKGMFTATGTKALLFTLDATHQLAEANENNNVATTSVLVKATTSGHDDDDDDGDDEHGDKVKVCHISGNGKGKTLEIGLPALAAHLAHGDVKGECGHRSDDDDSDNHNSTSTPSGSDKKIEKLIKKVNKILTERLKGKILLQVENNGEAWYVRPIDGLRIYLKDGSSAYSLMRSEGLGISDSDLSKIPIGFEKRFECADTDSDGLCDKLEDSLGSDPAKADSDGDGISDGVEVQNGQNPVGSGKLNFQNALTDRLKGKIVLQVQKHGEAWYINPDDGKRYYMPDGPSAYQIMRFLSLGISNNDLSQIDTK